MTNRRKIRAAVDRLLEAVVFKTVARRPGALIQSMPANIREQLKEVKAEDFNHRIK